MKACRFKPAVVAICALAGGCETVLLAPGADQIKVTRAPADVAGCTSLEILNTTQPTMTDPDAERQMQNRTLDLGGNVLLLTSSVRRSGIAYRCGDAKSPAGQAVAAPVDVGGPASIEIVQGQVDAFNRRDLEGFLNAYAEDAQVFDYSGRLLLAGKEAMREHYRKFFEPGAPWQASIQHRMVFDRFVIDQHKISGGPDGAAIEGVAIYEIKGGKIARVTVLRR